MSRALGEEVTWDEAKITSVDWRTYRPVSLGGDVPAIESVLINRPDAPANGAGETAITIVARKEQTPATKGALRSLIAKFSCEHRSDF